MSEASLLIFSLEHPANAGEWVRRNSKELHELKEDFQVISVLDERNSQVLVKEHLAYALANPGDGGVVNKIIEVDKDLDVASVLRAEIRNRKPHYVIFAAEEEEFSAEDISAGLLALECFPRTVAGTAKLLYRMPAILENLDTSDFSQGDQYVHSGRSLARLLALRAVSVPSFSNLIMRAAALGSDLPGDYDVKNAVLFRRRLVVDLLLRGSFWVDKKIVYAPKNAYRESADIIGYLNTLKFAAQNSLLCEGDTDKVLHNYLMEAKEIGLAPPELHFVESYIDNSADSLKRFFAEGALPVSDDQETQKVSFLGKKVPKNTLERCCAVMSRSASVAMKTAFSFIIGINPNANSMLERDQLFGLYRLLCASGYDTKIFLTERPKAPTAFLAEHAIEYAREEDITDATVCIVSDATEYSRLACAKKVVWHFSRRRMLESVDRTNEVLRYAYSRAVDPLFPVLRLPVYDLATLTRHEDQNEDSRQLHRLLLVSNGAIDKQLDRTAMLEISEVWPEDEVSFSELARESIFLLSCDWMSPRNEQALLAGIPVVLCGEQFWPNGDPMASEEHLTHGVAYSLAGNIFSDHLVALTKETLLYRADYEKLVSAVPDILAEFITEINRHYDNSIPMSEGRSQATFANVVPGI